MKRMMGLWLCQLLFLINCAGDPTSQTARQTGVAAGNTPPAYRPAFSIGDQVNIFSGDYAQSTGTIMEINLEEGGYLVKLSDRPSPVFIRSYQLRKNTTAVQQARPQLEPEKVVPLPPPTTLRPEPVFPSVRTPSVDPSGKLGRLAVLPIIGLDVDEYAAETFAWHLANEQSIHANFHVVPITPHIRRNVLSEESYTAIYTAGEDVDADYIMASFTRLLGAQPYFFSVVLDVRTRELIAGDFKSYHDAQDISSYFAPMSRKIMNIVRMKSSVTNAPKLSVELMAIPPRTANVPKSIKNDAALLSQILAIAVANTNSYAIYPRTDTIDAAVLEYETQRGTARKVFLNKDDITPAQYVLSSRIDAFTSKYQIVAEIVDIENSVLRRGSYINVELIDDAPNLISRLAAQIIAAPVKEMPQTEKGSK